jgi:hypothetical protein
MRKLWVRNLVNTYWQPVLLYGALLLFFGGLLWFRLGTLVVGYSPNELATLQASTNLRHILEHPLNAPFTLFTHAFLYFGEHSLFLVRAAATVVALVVLSTFYWLVRHWYGERSAILGTILFGSSAWFLHTARLGTPDIMMFGLLALVACSIWLKRTNNAIILIVIFGITASLLYVPGMIWFIVLGIMWQWKTIDRIFKHNLLAVTFGALVMLAVLAPLGWALYKSPELARVIAGLPAAGWPDPMDALRRVADIPLALFWHTPLNPEHWLARLPVLAAFDMAMLFLGGYLYLRHWRLKRVKLVLAVLFVGTVLIGLGGGVSLSLLVPFVYLLVAAGVGFLLDRWYTVFPRNTIAQGVGLGLVSLAVVATCWFHMRRYFVAWPSVASTKQIFIIKE